MTVKTRVTTVKNLVIIQNECEEQVLMTRRRDTMKEWFQRYKLDE